MDVQELLKASELTDELCKKFGVDVARHPLCRFAQMCGILTSLVGLYLFFGVLRRHLWRFPESINFKLMLWLFYLNSAMHALVFTVSQFKEFAKSFTIARSCDIVIDEKEYLYVRSALLFLNQFQVWLLIPLWLLRCSSITCYLKIFCPIVIGVTLAASTAVVPGLITYYLAMQSIKPLLIVGILTNTQQTKYLSLIYLLVCSMLLTVLIATWKVRKYIIARTLTPRIKEYPSQCSVTRFLWCISCLTLSLYCIQYFCTLFIATIEGSMFFSERYPLLQGLISCSYVLPLFTVFLPLITQYLLGTAHKEISEHSLDALIEDGKLKKTFWISSPILLQRKW